MAYGNAEKQRRYRQRLSARGRVRGQGGVTPEPAEAIRRIRAEGGGDAPHEPLDPQREPETGFSQKSA